MMDPQTDLYGNTIHEDIGGNRYIHDGYGQRDYLDKPSSDSGSSGSSGGGWNGGSGGGDGGGGETSSGGGGGGSSGGGGGSGSGGAGGCSGCLTLLFIGACLYFVAGYYFQPKNPPRLLPRPPQPTDSSNQTPELPIATPEVTPPVEGPTPTATTPPATNPVVRQDWHGKLQLVERNPRTNVAKSSTRWTDVKVALERTGNDVIGEIHFVEANVFAAVRGQIQEPTCHLVVDRVLSGPKDAVIVPCVLTGKHDAKQVFRGHWSPGLAGNESPHHPRFWLSSGLEQ